MEPPGLRIGAPGPARSGDAAVKKTDDPGLGGGAARPTETGDPSKLERVWPLPDLKLTKHQQEVLKRIADYLLGEPEKRYRNYQDDNDRHDSAETRRRLELLLGYTLYANNWEKCPKIFYNHLKKEPELCRETRDVLLSLIEPIAMAIEGLGKKPPTHFFFSLFYVLPGAADQHVHADTGGENADEYITVTLKVTEHENQGDTVFLDSEKRDVVLKTEAKAFDGTALHYGGGNRSELPRITLCCVTGMDKVDVNNRKNTPYTRRA